MKRAAAFGCRLSDTKFSISGTGELSILKNKNTGLAKGSLSTIHTLPLPDSDLLLKAISSKILNAHVNCISINRANFLYAGRGKTRAAIVV